MVIVHLDNAISMTPKFWFYKKPFNRSLQCLETTPAVKKFVAENGYLSTVSRFEKAYGKNLKTIGKERGTIKFEMFSFQ